MNKQTKPTKFITVRVDAALARSLAPNEGGIEKALDQLLRSRMRRSRAKPAKSISKKVADSHNAFLEKYGSLSDEFGTL